MSVKTLCDIQRIDLEITSILKEKELFLSELDGAAAALRGVDAKLDSIKNEIKELESAKAAKENARRENSERVIKDQKRLGEIKNDKQFTAVSKEISDAEKANKLIDMELTPLGEKISAKTAEAKTLEDEIAAKGAALKETSDKLSGNAAGWEAAVKAKEAEKTTLSAGVDKHLLKRYETIKAKRGGIGVAAVKNEACQACYIQIPPQVYIQLRKDSSGELLSCPHCHRILYFEEAPTAGGSPQTEPSAKD